MYFQSSNTHYTVSTLGHKYPLTACVQTSLVVHTSYTVVHIPVTILCSFTLKHTSRSLVLTSTNGEIPPCSRFSFTKVDHDRVVLFGGYQYDLPGVNDLCVFNLRNMVSRCGVLLCGSVGVYITAIAITKLSPPHFIVFVDTLEGGLP